MYIVAKKMQEGFWASITICIKMQIQKSRHGNPKGREWERELVLCIWELWVQIPEILDGAQIYCICWGLGIHLRWREESCQLFN